MSEKRQDVQWFVREYVCANGVCEKTKFPLRAEGERSARSGSDYKRRLRKAEKNVTQAKHEAARTANNNFFAGRDKLLTCTISDEGMELLVARAGTDDPDELLLRLRTEIGNWMKRARRRLRAMGIEAKYMAFTADLDGKRLTPARPHVHMLVNREAAEVLEETWDLGLAGSRTLWSAHQGDLTDLVEYLMAQTRTVGTEKRYIPSRNLEKPLASRPRYARNPDAELRVPRGCSLIWKSEQRAGRPQKIRYYRPSADRKKGGNADEQTEIQVVELCEVDDPAVSGADGGAAPETGGGDHAKI